ncbi:MAG: right-handed parallel beta-helix repeat-containing protein [Acidobacteria bacterium]|nr:right-handed parallel beta-helix repeat-containing protein [Acidobacteriota bacterium]
MVALVSIFIGPLPLHGQSWTPPVGIPHPGQWFLATSGSVQQVSSGGTSRTFSGNGTANSPVIFRGVGSPTFTGQVTISGSYVIVENIVVRGGVVRFSGDHLVLRNSEVSNNQGSISKSTVSTIGGSSDVVVFRNKIHDNGQWQGSSEVDIHGVTGAGPLSRIWVLENEMYHHGGDSVQFGHNQRNSIVDVYVGRNVMHHDRENAVDLKEVSNSVVSENTMYGYRATSSSEGAAIVIHYCPLEASIVNNLIYDSQVGISTSSLNSTCSGKAVTNRIVGNVIHGILGHGLQGWGTGKVTQIVNNTFCDIGGSGIDLTNAASGSLIENNLFSGISGSDVEATGGASQRNNLADGRNPVFVNAGAGDYRLEASSPAVDAGVASSVYAGFQNVFGRSIAVDRAGGSRPAGSAWDIGAYEYGASSSGGGTGSNVPTPPSNVRIH